MTEIMYDIPGSDDGREWVEIQNRGDDTVDITGWKFFEGGVNHKLTPIGSALLPGGTFAIITSDVATFRTAWPSFSGILFESSFSLKNTGEDLSLKNASSTVLAQVFYSAAMAKGDGNSLNMVGEHWVGRRPTPGSSVDPDSILPPQKPVIRESNLPPVPAVVHTDAIEGNGESGEPALAASVIRSDLDVSSAPPGIGIWAWLFGLAVVIGLGSGGIFMWGSKKHRSGYTIIEDKS